VEFYQSPKTLRIEGALKMEEIRIEDIGEILRNRIKGYEKEIETSEVGTIISVGDGVTL